MADWIAQARRSVMDNPTALVTIIATEGSVPRAAGTRMVIALARAWGTIGGGQLEYQASEQARAILQLEPGSWRIQDYPLGPLLGQCCGGRVRLLIEHLDPALSGWLSALADGDVLVSRLHESHIERAIGDPTAPPKPIPARGERPIAGATLCERIGSVRIPLYLFGAGHVGQAIARAAAPLPFSLAWFDSRQDYAELPNVFHVAEDDLPDCARDAPAEAALLIFTHDHGLDYRLTAAALCGRARFVGLIGSSTKRARFRSRLVAEHIDAARLTCPIGLPGIRGKEPEVIAAATVAQLLTLRQPAIDTQTQA